MRISISHWGVFDCDDRAQCDPQLVSDALEARLIRIFNTDWNDVLDRRFPNGIPPMRTPFLERMRKVAYGTQG